MSEDIYIFCKGLSIGYQDRMTPSVAVKSNLTVRALKGEMVALLGGNGVGKSTLLRTLAGFQPPLSGELWIHNKPAAEYRADELAREMSFVSTEVVRVAHLTVYELVGLGRYPYTNWFGELDEKDREIISKAIRDVGLSGYEDRQVSRISDGERQRAMIARALAQDTRILVLDEPTAFLDISNKYEIVRILHQLVNEQGKCIIFSTHDLHTALSMADRIWLMLEGEVVEGIPEVIAEKGYFDSLFPGNPQLKFDVDKGDFTFRKNPNGMVRISADGFSRRMAIKALERLGFEIVDEELDGMPASKTIYQKVLRLAVDPELAQGILSKDQQPVEMSVIQTEKGWSIHLPDFSAEVETLEELCRTVKLLALRQES